MNPKAQKGLQTQYLDFPVRQMAKAQIVQMSPKTAQKSFQTTRKRKARPKVHRGRTYQRPDLRACRVVFVSLPHQLMVKSSRCWLSWGKVPGINKSNVSSCIEKIQSFLSIWGQLVAKCLLAGLPELKLEV
jgi:hypothetical protein